MKRRGRGGKRPGAGRPKIDPLGTQVVAVRLTPAHIARVERWMDTHGLANFSAAVRAMIDVATATD